MNTTVSKGLKISSISFDLICLIQMKRISMGYSQSELSFLIGRGKDFIRDREALKTNKEFWMSDLFTMAKIFRCDIADFAGQEKPVRETLHLFADRNQIHQKINYEVYKIESNKAPELLHKISEIDPAKRFCPKTQKRLLLQTRMLMLLVIDSGFFDHACRSPLEVFQQCKMKGGVFVTPQFVADALDYWSLSASPILLKRSKHKMLGFVYEGIPAPFVVKDQDQ